MSDVVDAAVVEDEPGQELVPAQQSGTLFRTDDPVEVVEKASRVADALKGVLRKQGLTKKIGDKEHVLVEGWTTLGSMLGVVPVCTWTRPVERGWEARVEARTLDGRVIGAAEAQCTRDENWWSKAEPYAIRSMAQTRATSKALRGPLGFIVTLAGYEATPEAEMPPAAAPRASEDQLPFDAPTEDPVAVEAPPIEQSDPGPPASPAQQGFVRKLLEPLSPEAQEKVLKLHGATSVEALSKSQAHKLIDELKS